MIQETLSQEKFFPFPQAEKQLTLLNLNPHAVKTNILIFKKN